jgi:hypothetical protein
MRRPLTALLICALPAALPVAASPAAGKPAAVKPMTAQLLKLETSTRMEQRCNGRAAGAIRREQHGFDPDEVVAYAFADSTIEGAHVEAPGAAIRSHGRWYHVAYSCHATPDGLGIEDFRYTLGDEVPRAQWDDHYLVPK